MSSEFEGDGARSQTGRVFLRTLFGRLRARLLVCWNGLFDHYRPETHYMRGEQACPAAAPAKAPNGPRR